MRRRPVTQRGHSPLRGRVSVGRALTCPSLRRPLRRLLTIAGIAVAGWLVGGAAQAAAGEVPGAHLFDPSRVVQSETLATSHRVPHRLGAHRPPSPRALAGEPILVTPYPQIPARWDARAAAVSLSASHPQLRDVEASGAAESPSDPRGQIASDRLVPVCPSPWLGLPAQAEPAVSGVVDCVSGVGIMDEIASRASRRDGAEAGTAAARGLVAKVASPAGSGASMSAVSPQTRSRAAPPHYAHGRSTPSSPSLPPRLPPPYTNTPTMAKAQSGQYPDTSGQLSPAGPADPPSGRAFGGKVAAPSSTARTAVDEPSFSPD